MEKRYAERCVKRQGEKKQCPLGQALYEVAVPARRGKVFKAGAPRGTLVSATIPEHSKYICGKKVPKNAVQKISEGTLPPKLYKTAKHVGTITKFGKTVRIPHHPLNAYSSEAAKKAAAKKAAAKKAAAKKAAAKKTAAKKTKK
jgi:hypothetical protein